MNKLFAVLISFLLHCESCLAFPPVGVIGQGQTTNLYPTVLKAPNAQITNLGSGAALFETGNQNILTNPSNEHTTNVTGWSASGGTYTAESTVVLHGKKSIKNATSASTVVLTNDSTLYQAQFADGVQGLASVWIKSSLSAGTLQVCSRQAGVTSTTNCVTVVNSGKWQLYKVPFILGGTSNGISIASTSSATGDFYVDNAFVGAVDLAQAQSSSSLLGTTTVTGCAGIWSTTSTTFAAPAVQTTCVYANTGLASSPATMLPAITISNVPAGDVVVLVEGYMGNQTAAKSAYFQIYDGTNQFRETTTIGGANLAGFSGNLFSSSYTYTANQTNLTLQIRMKTDSAGTAFVYGTSPQALTIKVFHYPTGSTSTLSSTNADTDWADCSSAVATNSAGWGSSPTYAFQCKRQGADLLMKGRLTVGTTPTGVEARVGLPTWNGVQLTSAGTGVIPLIQVGGVIGYSANSATSLYSLIEPSVGYITLGRQTSTTSSLSKMLGNNFSAADILAYGPVRIPISGWTGSNGIIASLNEIMTTPGVLKPKTCYAAWGGVASTLAAPVNHAASTVGVEVLDTCGTFTIPTTSSSGFYLDATFAAGTFANTSYIHCSCQGWDTTTGNSKSCSWNFTTGDNTWTTKSDGGYRADVETTTMVGTPSTSYVQVKCEGVAP
jgi:hypothetical protein